MIRNAIYTVYNGTEYRIFRNRYGKYVLVSYDKNDESKGFVKEDDEDEIYLKEVNSSEVNEVYDITTLAEYKKIECAVLRQSDTEYLLYIGDDVGQRLGFENVGRSEYQKWVNKEDVNNVHEVKCPVSNFFGS